MWNWREIVIKILDFKDGSTVRTVNEQRPKEIEQQKTQLEDEINAI